MFILFLLQYVISGYKVTRFFFKFLNVLSFLLEYNTGQSANKVLYWYLYYSNGKYM